MVYFNPRPREEGDFLMMYFSLFTCRISIHALVKRATYTAGNYVKILHISIHALVKRATAPETVEQYIGLISIHALVKRATILYPAR